jgi:hypothetical protein
MRTSPRQGVWDAYHTAPGGARPPRRYGRRGRQGPTPAPAEAHLRHAGPRHGAITGLIDAWRPTSMTD